MARTVRFLVLGLMLALVGAGWGHPMPSSAVQLRFRADDIDAELRLPTVELEAGFGKIFPSDPAKVIEQFGPEIKAYVWSHVRPTSADGRAWTVLVGNLRPADADDIYVDLKMRPPSGASVEQLDFRYDVILEKLASHTALVTVASDWRTGVLGDKPELLATLNMENRSVRIDRSHGSWFRGFAATFELGARHIAEGTDHLLFLLALLLPAPLIARGRKWDGFAGGKVALRRIVKVVSAFTVGHSITLVIGALGWKPLPSAVIESAIAVSIFISAVHALVPIFSGREVFIAGGFGLVHGLAFAGTLTEFGFDPLTLVSSVLGFNLGIEAVQLLVIVATMPWLVLLAKTRVYRPFRIGGAVVTAAAAATWFMERAFGWPNPVGHYVELAASHAIWLVAGLAVVAIAVNLGPLGKRLAVSAPAG